MAAFWLTLGFGFDLDLGKQNGLKKKRYIILAWVIEGNLCKKQSKFRNFHGRRAIIPERYFFQPFYLPRSRSNVNPKVTKMLTSAKSQGQIQSMEMCSYVYLLYIRYSNLDISIWRTCVFASLLCGFAPLAMATCPL